MTMTCKDCGHEINVDGTEKDSKVGHITNGLSISEECPYCDCKKAVRRREPTYCKHCGHEIIKPGNKRCYKDYSGWGHVHVIDTWPGSAPRRVGSIAREWREKCDCGCTNPEPEVVE